MRSPSPAIAKIEEIAQYTSTSGAGLPISGATVVHANGAMRAKLVLEMLSSFRSPMGEEP